MSLWELLSAVFSVDVWVVLSVSLLICLLFVTRIVFGHFVVANHVPLRALDAGDGCGGIHNCCVRLGVD